MPYQASVFTNVSPTDQVPIGTPVTYTAIITNPGPGESFDLIIDINCEPGSPWNITTTGSPVLNGPTSGTGPRVQAFPEGQSIPEGSTVTIMWTTTKTSAATTQEGISVTTYDEFGASEPDNTTYNGPGNHQGRERQTLAMNWVTKATEGPYTRAVGDVITSTVDVSHFLLNPGDHSVSDSVPTTPAGTTRTWTAEFIQVGASATATGWTASGTGDINDAVITMEGEGTVRYTIMDTVNNFGTYRNEAFVDGNSNLGNEVLIEGPADSTLTKVTNGADVRAPGSVIESIVTFTNTGGQTITGANPNIVDFVPTSGVLVDQRTWTVVRNGGATGGTPSSGTGTVDLCCNWNIPPGGSIVVTILDTISNSATTGETYENQALVFDAPNNPPPANGKVVTVGIESDPPTVDCNGAGNFNAADADVFGIGHDVPADHTYRIFYGTTMGGPYTDSTPNTIAGNATANQNFTYSITGLSSNTTYYFVAEVLDATNAIVATSTECTWVQPAFTGGEIAALSKDIDSPSTSNMTSGNDIVSTVEFSVAGIGAVTDLFINDPVPASPPGMTRAWEVIDDGGAVSGLTTGDTGTGDINIGPIEWPQGGSTGLVRIQVTDSVPVGNTGQYTNVVDISADSATPNMLQESSSDRYVSDGICMAPFAITSTSADLDVGSDGLFVPPGGAIFRWGTTPGGPYPNTTSFTPAFGNATVSGLNPETTYYYVQDRYTSDGGDLMDTTVECSFTTDVAATLTPTATCEPASGVSDTAANLNGTTADITPGQFRRFSWGTTDGGPYPNATANVAAANDSFLEAISGLSPLTDYYYVVEVLDADGTTVLATSSQCTFTTQDTAVDPPTVDCLPATNINAGDATLAGVGHNVPADNTLRISYGTTMGGPYTLQTPNTIAGDTNVNQPFNYPVSGLMSGTTYYSVAEVLNSGGTVVATSTECTWDQPAFTGGEIAGLDKNIIIPGTSNSVSGVDIVSEIKFSVGGIGAVTDLFINDAIPTVPAGITRTWEVLEDGGAVSGLTTGDTGTGDIALGPIEWPQGGSTNLVTIQVTDSVPAGNVGEYQNTVDIQADSASPTSLDAESISVYVSDGICMAPAATTDTTADLDIGSNGLFVPPGTAVFRWGTTPGGPYPNTSPTATAFGVAQITGLSPETSYYYIQDRYNGSGVLMDSTTECSLTTDVAATDNVTLTKVTDPGPYYVGQQINSTVTVTNTGTTDVPSYIVSDPLPANVNRSFTSVAAGGATNNTAGPATTAINDDLSLPAGSSVTYTIGDTPTAPGNYLNEVTGTNNGFPPNGPIPGGPEGPVSPQITATKTTPPGPYQVGDTITSTVVVTNNSSVSGTTTVSDPIPTSPAGTTRAFTATTTGGATGFTAVGTTDIMDTVVMPGGSTVTYTINDTVTAQGTYQNFVTAGTEPPVSGGEPEEILPPPLPPATPCSSRVVQLCRQTGTQKMCDTATDTPIMLVTVASASGDIIPVGSTEFEAPAGDGVFGTMGFYRSYYTDLQGNYLTPQPTAVSSECGDTPLDTEVVCVVANAAPDADPTTGLLVIDSSVMPPTFVLYVDGVDATATHTQVACPNNDDYELRETCLQSTTDPSQTYTRIDWFVEDDLTAPVSTLYYDNVLGTYSGTAPVGVAPCSDCPEVFVGSQCLQYKEPDTITPGGPQQLLWINDGQANGTTRVTSTYVDERGITRNLTLVRLSGDIVPNSGANVIAMSGGNTGQFELTIEPPLRGGRGFEIVVGDFDNTVDNNADNSSEAFVGPLGGLGPADSFTGDVGPRTDGGFGSTGGSGFGSAIWTDTPEISTITFGFISQPGLGASFNFAPINRDAIVPGEVRKYKRVWLKDLCADTVRVQDHDPISGASVEIPANEIPELTECFDAEKSVEVGCLQSPMGRRTRNIYIVKTLNPDGSYDIGYCAIDGTQLVLFDGETVLAGECPIESSTTDNELECLCDVTLTPQGPVQTQFLRRYVIDGETVTTVDTTIDGVTPYQTQGLVQKCSEVEVENDAVLFCTEGEQWVERRFTYTDATTGQQIAVVTGYFNPEGVETDVRPTDFTYGECCCETPVNDGCWESADGTTSGKYVTILGTDGVLRTTDPATNLAVDSALFVDCDRDEPWAVQTTGATAAVLPFDSEVESITVTVFAGSVSVDTGNGIIVVPAGSSFTWGQGTDQRIRVNEMTFTGVGANADFVVHGEHRY